MSSKRITVAVMDDHPLMRRGIAETLAEADDIEVVALGGSAEEALRAAHEIRPNVFLVDAMMPGSGIEATREISAQVPACRVIVFSIREDFETVQQALQAGARGYLTKGVEAGDLIDAVRKVAGGGSYVSPELAARLLTLNGSATGSPNGSGIVPGSLTDRESQMLALVGRGLSNLEIATNLGLAENTVKHQLTPLFRKLGVRNRTEAALLARERTGSPAA